MNHRLKDPAIENRHQAFRVKLGAIIRRERTNARLSRRVLCERVGLAETSLCRIEDGTMTPSIVLVMWICCGKLMRPSRPVWSCSRLTPRCGGLRHDPVW